MKVCELEGCEKEFKPYREAQRFCSQKHRDAYWNIVKPKRRAEPGTFDEKRCAVCNKRFTPVMVTQKYDREGCRWVAQGNRRRARTLKKTIRLNHMGWDKIGERPHKQIIDRTIYP